MGAHGLVIPRKSHLRFRWDDVGAAELRRFAQGETDRRAALRALATAQALEGASQADAARVVGRERQSLRDAVLRYVEPRGSPDNAEGLAGLRDRPRLGRPEKLTAAQREELRAWVLAGPDPEADGVSSDRLLDVAAHVQERWAVSYGLSALSRLPHRMGLSWQTTRPAHPKGDAGARAFCKEPRCHSEIAPRLARARGNTVHLGIQVSYITGRVFWDRQRWRVFLLAFRPAFVSATTSALA